MTVISDLGRRQNSQDSIIKPNFLEIRRPDITSSLLNYITHYTVNLWYNMIENDHRTLYIKIYRSHYIRTH